MIRRSGRTQRLGFRLAFLLAVALLPLGVISALQSRALVSEARARSEAALLGETRAASIPELSLIRRAQGAAEGLSFAVVELSRDREACSAIMRDLVDTSGVLSFAGFYDTEGDMECSTAGRPFSFGQSPALKAAVADPRPGVNVNRDAPLSGTSVLFARHPVWSESGELLGFTAVSVPHSALERYSPDRDGIAPLLLATFDEDGEVLTSSAGFEALADFLPRDRALKAFVGGNAVAFTALSGSGDLRTFSIVPLVPDRLYALGSWRAEEMLQPVSLSALPPATTPILMWLVSLAVAIFAAERLVTRHIRNLTRAITSFAGGNRLVGQLDLRQAPMEIRQAGEAFERMTVSILRDEAEVEDMVHQKEVLLREVHHRVKNNLQLIASIMSMQARQARSSEAKVLVKRLQDRVMSLATIHRGLYQTTGLTDVRADELLSDIVRQIVNLATGPGRRFDVETKLDEIYLTPDQAVPLALLVTEALTNAMKYAGGENGSAASLLVALRREGDDRAVIEIVNSVTIETVANADATDAEATGLGTRLVAAFAQQLGGEVVRDEGDGFYNLSVRFAIRPLTGAEQRSVAEPEAESA